ncbi:MAG: hypothetical protein P1V36_14115 [Planctomycetota bacterium]|nr:hypothetical protein [Planctomycetota bacterium]
MTFALSGLWIALGLAGLAAGLYLLQRLRVRHRTVPVVTTLFWKQALEETRARVLVQRFRHLPAYLLLLAICALLWLGFARPEAAAGEGARHVLLLDASAGMAEGTRFADAKAVLLEDARALPASRRQVLFCGGHVRTLLAPGENALLLEKRLAGLAPEQAPSSLARVARAVRQEGPDVVVHAYGEPAADVGLIAFGLAPAASGRWDALDLLALPATGEPFGGAAPLLDGFPILGDINSENGGSHATGLWRDLPARGGRVVVRQGGREHALVLPQRQTIKVWFGLGHDEALRALLTPVLRADPGIEIGTTGGDVQIGGTLTIGRTGSLSFAQAPADTIAVAMAGASRPGFLGELSQALALAEVDGASLADALGRAVTVTAREPAMLDFGSTRRVTLDRALLDPDVGFLRTRAFPLLIAGAIRLLAHGGPLAPYVAAGEPVEGVTAALTPQGGAAQDPLDVPFTPAVAGAYTSPAGATSYASLQRDPSATPFAATADAVAAETSMPWARWIALLAFVLLAVEWMLLRRGRIP